MDGEAERFQQLLDGDLPSSEETADLTELADLAFAIRARPAARPRPEFRAHLRDLLRRAAIEP